MKAFSRLALALAVGLIGGRTSADAPEAQPAEGVWQCMPLPAQYAPRQLLFGPEPGELRMAAGGTAYAGRYTIEHKHVAAALAASESGVAAQDLTLGLATGRMVARERLADGSRPVVFTGVCRRIGRES